MMNSVFDKKNNCCGCGACAQACPVGAISMVSDEEGFLYPEIDGGKCIDCGLCKRVCAFGKDALKNENTAKVYALKATDEIRSESTSGGMFTLLSDEILKRGGVVYGVAFDNNFKPVHIRCDSVEKRDLCRGSKYVQSDTADSFKKIKEDLKRGVHVMFTGTPCQCAALDSFLANADRDKLIITDIVCHGTPSPKLFSEYIGFVEKVRGKKISKYHFRAKNPRGGTYETIGYTDGTKEIKSVLAEAWNNVFYTCNALRPSCYNCKYTCFKRPSDITIADFWGIEIFEKGFDDGRGVSLVITSTKKGEELFKAVSGDAVITERTIEEAAAKNPNLSAPTECPQSRDGFWTDYRAGGIEVILKKFGQYTTPKKFKRLIKKMLGK